MRCVLVILIMILSSCSNNSSVGGPKFWSGRLSLLDIDGGVVEDGYALILETSGYYAGVTGFGRISQGHIDLSGEYCFPFHIYTNRYVYEVKGKEINNEYLSPDNRDYKSHKNVDDYFNLMGGFSIKGKSCFFKFLLLKDILDRA